MVTDLLDVARQRAGEARRRDDALRRVSRGGVCPECGDLRALLAEYRTAGWLGLEERAPAVLLTPEGEQAGCISARFRTADREALAELLCDDLCTASGDGFVEVVATPTGDWVRANLWFDADGSVVLVTSAGERTAAYDLLFDHCLPPVRRGMASGAAASAANLRLLPVPPPGTRAPQPSVHAALDELIRAAERRWVDGPEPILDGLTPREAWRRPGTRGDVRRLVRLGTSRAPALYGELAALDPRRVLARLARREVP